MPVNPKDIVWIEEPEIGFCGTVQRQRRGRFHSRVGPRHGRRLDDGRRLDRHRLDRRERNGQVQRGARVEHLVGAAIRQARGHGEEEGEQHRPFNLAGTGYFGCDTTSQRSPPSCAPAGT